MSAKAERLISLVVELLGARRPLTRRELTERTGLYEQDDPESARRMFERDKDDLRRLGVPVETRRLSRLREEYGYIVERGAYELPDVDLTREEVAALAVALRLTGSGPARLGLTKLAARAPDPGEEGGGDNPATPAVTVPREPLDALADPLVTRRPVAFGYRTAGGRAGRRTVDPYAVVARRGAWYLVGRDHDRDGLRAFRLDRMRGPVTPAGGPASFEVPRDLDLRAAVSGPSRGGVDARVAVDPELRWEAEREGGVATGAVDGGWPVYRFAGLGRRRLITWVVSMGPRARLLAPADVREEVVDRLRAVLDGGGER